MQPSRRAQPTWTVGVQHTLAAAALPAPLGPLINPVNKPRALPAVRTGNLSPAELALASRPRYHVAAGKGTFWARQPYLNADLGAGAHVTRFIGLAEVGWSWGGGGCWRWSGRCLW